MRTGSHWRDKCRPIIKATIDAWNGKDEKQLRRALYEAYPFGERAMYPYRVWLNEISVQLGKRKTYWHLGRKKKVAEQNKNQIDMFPPDN